MTMCITPPATRAAACRSAVLRDGCLHSQQESRPRAEASIASVLQAARSQKRADGKTVRSHLTRENKTLCTALIQVLQRCLRFEAQTCCNQQH